MLIELVRCNAATLTRWLLKATSTASQRNAAAGKPFFSGSPRRSCSRNPVHTHTHSHIADVYFMLCFRSVLS